MTWTLSRASVASLQKQNENGDGKSPQPYMLEDTGTYRNAREFINFFGKFSQDGFKCWYNCHNFHTLSVDCMTNFQTGLVAWDFFRSEEFSSVSTKETGAKIRSFSRNSCWMKSKRSSQMGVGARSQPQLCRTFSRARSVVMWDSNRRNLYPIGPCPNALVQLVTPESPQMSKTSC